jgi:hypothetical protein
MDEVLPEGWQKLTDPSSSNDYFAKEATGEALWTKLDNTALKQVNPTRSATAAEASAYGGIQLKDRVEKVGMQL